MLVVGVLSLQGGVIEHISMVQDCGFKAIEIKKPSQIKEIDSLILPGGESTTMSLLSREQKLLKEIKNSIEKGLPVFGTCAGAILLAKKVGKKSGLIGAMDLGIERNAYGRQLNSFEADLKIDGFQKSFPGVFIRAPVINSVGKNGLVLSSYNKKPVLVKQNQLLASTFHPELTLDSRLHKFFLKEVGEESAEGF